MSHEVRIIKSQDKLFGINAGEKTAVEDESNFHFYLNIIILWEASTFLRQIQYVIGRNRKNAEKKLLKMCTGLNSNFKVTLSIFYLH